MSPDVFLSRNGVRYDGSGLKGTPAEILANLITLNNTRTWSEITNQFEYYAYRTPGFSPAPFSSASYEPANVFAENLAMNAYYMALGTGDLGKVRAAVDDVNRVRSIKGGSELIPLSDFQILAHGQNALGAAARFLAAQLNGDGDTPWFFTFAAYQALKSYVPDQWQGTVTSGTVQTVSPFAPRK